jgi:hypothetical protein
MGKVVGANKQDYFGTKFLEKINLCGDSGPLKN